MHWQSIAMTQRMVMIDLCSKFLYSVQRLWGPYKFMVNLLMAASTALVTFTFPAHKFQSSDSNSTSLNVMATLEMGLLQKSNLLYLPEQIIVFQKVNKNKDVNNLCGILWSFLSVGFRKLATSILLDRIVLNWQLILCISLPKSIIWRQYNQGNSQDSRGIVEDEDLINIVPIDCDFILQFFINPETPWKISFLK